MALALDGFTQTPGGSGTTRTVTGLSTTASNCVIVLTMTLNDHPSTGVSSPNVTGWTLRKRQASTNPNNRLELWAGVAASPLSSETITVTFGTSPGFFVPVAFGVSGADTGVVWDSNAALPDFGTTGERSITTTAADCFLIGQYRLSESAPTAGGGWTRIGTPSFTLVEYQIVSAAQTGLAVTIGTGAGTENAGIADAIVAAGGGGGGAGGPRRRRIILCGGR